MHSPNSFSHLPDALPSDPNQTPQSPSERPLQKKYFIQLVKQMILAGLPTIFCLELNIVSQVINVYLIGHLNDANLLGALGIALVWLNTVAYTVFVSLNTGLVSLSAQAFGKKDYQLTGLYFQRGALINFLFFLISLLILLFSSPILKGFGLDELIVDDAMDYIFYSIPSIFFFTYYDLAKSFLQVQRIFNPQLIIQVVSGIFHYITASIFINAYDMKLTGAALARTFSDCLNFILIYSFIYFKKPTPETWLPWSREALKGWKNYIKVSITIALTFYMESLCYEIMTIMAGNLPRPEDLASHVAMANTSTMFFFISFGLSIVMQNFVGNAMGGGNSRKALLITKIGVMMNVFFVGIFVIAMIIFRHSLATFFTQEDSVVVILEGLIKIYAFLSAADFTQIFLSGVLKGIGKENWTLGMYMIVYYFFGIPLCYILSFTAEMGVYGLWTSWAISLYVVTIILIVGIYRVNWEEQCNEIRERLLQDQDKGEEIEMIGKNY